MSECEYCKCDMEGESLEDRYAIESMVDNVFIYNWCECGKHTIYEINFCPMCGRRLKGEDEENYQGSYVRYQHRWTDLRDFLKKYRDEKCENYDRDSLRTLLCCFVD